MTLMTPHPYPAYKPSGIDWLGDVPDHWEMIPNRALMNQRKDVVGAFADNFTLLSLTRRGIVPRDVDNAFGKFPSSFDTYQVIEPGDLVFCLFDIDETPRTVGRSRLRGMLTGAYTRFVCGDVDTTEFLYLLYLSLDDGKLLRPLYSGLRKTISTATFLRTKVALPPLPEQQAIVRYLDHVDRRIRRYVTAKRRLIALLEEEKQAIINSAVTQGLDPNVRLKPSGVEWLGNVPEHWQRRRLKSILQPIDIRSTTGSETLLSLRRDHGVVVYAEHFERPSQSRSLVGFKLVGVGQLVVNRLQANNGLIFDSTVEGLVSPDYSVLEGMSPLNMKFLSDLLRTSSYRAYFRQNATGLGTGTAGFLRLYDDTLLETPVYLPPVGEQGAIVGHKDRATADIDAAIVRARRRIELVQEYRTRLIADVVTGKLDVREAAAQLPDEDGDQNPIEESGPLADDPLGDLYDIDESVGDSAMEQEVTA